MKTNKTINCGKIDWNRTGHKINVAELKLELVQKNGKWVFSCCGSVWNSKRTDILAGGQCLDEMFKYKELAKFKEIYELWKNWHLNDLTAGSPKQEEVVRKWMIRREKAGKQYDYTEACKMLKKKGLLVDGSYIHDGMPYKYGTAWLTRDIPEEDLAKIRKWIES